MPLPSQRKYDGIHAKNVDKYARQVRAAYQSVIKEVSQLAIPLSLNPNDEFYFRNYPILNKKVNTLLNGMYDNVYGTTVMGINTEWELAVEKNNELAQYVFGKDIKELPAEVRDNYLSGNDGAKRNFIARKDNGLGLSDKIWNNTTQFKQELELALETSIGKGKSAASIAKDITGYLNEPDKLFRRVRDKENGVLRLSKAAKSYHPGQGRYRSSYKNAVRLTRNETNFSYEGSQHLKRQQQDFIVGVEIRVSPQHNPADDKGGISCFALQGLYPKDFDFTYKWHVNCKCMSLHVLKTRDELDKDLDQILAGNEPNTPSVNAVDTLPQSFSNYVAKNEKTWQNWQTPPRFITSNKALIKETTINPTNTYSPESLMEFLKSKGFKNPVIDLSIDTYKDLMNGFDFEELFTDLDNSLKRYGDVEWSSFRVRQQGINSATIINRVKINGQLIEIERGFYKDKKGIYVEHAFFNMPESLQKFGISKDVLKSYYKQYNKSNINSMELVANLEVGGYAWARYGFSAPKEQVAHLISTFRTLKSDAMQVFDSYFQLYPEATKFPMNLLSDINGMRANLLGTKWEGSLNLKDPIAKQIFEDYLNKR